VKSGGTFHFFAAITILSLSMTHGLHAAHYPARPVKLLVGAPAGGTTDTIALKNEGATSVGNNPKEFAAFVREDIERWAPLVKSSGATPN
jgi:tripartite-type tricarboxylate transporter receptor subunit TctC